MCEPVTIIAGASLALAAVSAYGQVQQGKNAQKVANANADAQEIAAKDAINTGNANADQQRQQTRQLQGQQAAAFGAAGTDMTSGSALNIFGNTAQGGQLDSLTTINNAERQGAGLNFQAGVSRAQGQMDRSAANLGATTTILNSALSAYGSYQSSGALNKPAAQGGGASSNNMFNNARGSRYGSNAYTF
ncbi:hypothetical protein JKX24_16550 [Serratia proteamaculans]|uniref:Uncharacterized protein n=1 Tax=Serratia proteamaculans TaxID=28151 RepID=A0A7U0RM04_SERPR|nr:hypothetical protein [Serratia proteamaculans]MBO1505228.1 hypothetical protein [Serratia proteamaculans]QQX51812.1 hypothetical protein JKX24_16550 [Serratia proteamaculans]